MRERQDLVLSGRSNTLFTPSRRNHESRPGCRQNLFKPNAEFFSQHLNHCPNVEIFEHSNHSPTRGTLNESHFESRTCWLSLLAFESATLTPATTGHRMTWFPPPTFSYIKDPLSAQDRSLARQKRAARDDKANCTSF